MKKYLLAILIIVLLVWGAYTLTEDKRQQEAAQDQAAQSQPVTTPPVEPVKETVQQETKAQVDVPSIEQVEEIEQDKTPQEVEQLEKELTEQTKTEEKKMTNPTVVMKTNMGDIKIELFMDTMPVTAGNFKKLVEQGFYDGVIFHRVIPKFMIQGGDPDGTGRGGPGYTIKDEFTDNNKNDRGTLSMANAGPNTGGSQFFINVNNNNFLDDKHPVFGKVTSGMEVVDRIVNVPRNHMDRPNEVVEMTKVTIQE